MIGKPRILKIPAESSRKGLYSSKFLEELKILDNLHTNDMKRSKKSVNISECFELFSNKELLDENIYCTPCGNRSQSTKRIEICRLPKILIIHFKRFWFIDNNTLKT